jgi:penicillin amidase
VCNALILLSANVEHKVEQFLAKMLKVFSILILLVVLCAAAFGFWSCRQALPILDGVVTISELDQPVKVDFDQSVVPYIHSSSPLDLYLAQGYVTASERMFQMDVMRRFAEGKLSEIFGSGCMTQDKLMRTIGFNRLAQQELTSLGAKEKASLRAYCTGVNAYINQNSNRLSPEFMLLGYRPRAWEPQDTLAILKFLQYELDESWRLDELRERVIDKAGVKLASAMFEEQFKPRQTITSLGPSPVPRLVPRLGLAPDLLKGTIASPRLSYPDLGSNAWVVSGQLSSSGGCLMACDKHCLFTSPELFYVCSLQGPGFHAAGATIPGVPGIILGRNQNIAWAMTSLKADVQDLYIEQFSDKFPNKYRVPGGWSNAQEITEEIPQRFAGNLLEKITVTRHGPVLVKSDTSGIALNWRGARSTFSILNTIFSLNEANSWPDFRKALHDYDGSPQIFVYADRQGNIGLQTAGRIPIRKCDRRTGNYTFSGGSTPMPGWSDDCAWQEDFKFEDLPFRFNPADGFVIANDPRQAFISTTGSTVGAQRVLAVLSNYRKIAQHPDLPDMSALQGDQLAYLSGPVKAEIASALKETQNVDRYKQQALVTLEKWDGQLKPDSAAACIYESFLTTFLRRVLEPKLGSSLSNEYAQRWSGWSRFIAKILKDKPLDLLPPGERTYDTFILTTLTESLKNLKIALKSEQMQSWSWKNLHKIDYQEFARHFGWASAFAFVFAPGATGIGGDQDCVNACNVELSQAPWCLISTTGPTERVVIDLADQDKFYQSLALGQSGHFLSNNRFDQVKTWLNVEPHAVAFSEKQTQLQMQHALILSNRVE